MECTGAALPKKLGRSAFDAVGLAVLGFWYWGIVSAVNGVFNAHKQIDEKPENMLKITKLEKCG